MTWNFQVRSTRQQRQLSRILQVLETQAVIHSFSAEADDEELIVSFRISSGEDKEHRITALLYRLQGVLEVTLQRVRTEE